MRLVKKVVIVVLSLFVLSSAVSAGITPKANSKLNKNSIERNYLAGINSDNFGLRASSAYFLGELKSEKAILPLLKMLHSEKDESARILAALSLCKIGTDKSLFAIKMAAKFDDSERVRKMCANFYNHHCQN